MTSLCIFLLVDINGSLHTFVSRWRFIDNSKYDWLMIMTLDGAEVGFANVTI